MSLSQPSVGQSSDESASRRTLSHRPRSRPVPLRQRVDDLAELIGDGQYAAPVVRLARVHSTCEEGGSPIRPGHPPAVADKDGPVTYMYSFDGGLPVEDIDDDRSANAGVRRIGGYKRDLAYAFGAPLADGIDPFATVNHAYTDADRKLARTVLTYWTNFIRTGFVIVRNNRNGLVRDMERRQTLITPGSFMNRYAHFW